MNEKRPGCTPFNEGGQPTDDVSKVEKRPPFFLLACVTALFALGGMVGITALVVVSAMDRDAQLLQAEGDRWQPLPHELPGTPNRLLAADDGALWVRTMFRGSLARYAGGEWEIFRGEDFRTPRNYPFVGFALEGDACWTVIDEILLRYDGETWEHVSLLPMEPDVDRPVAIAADPQGVWLLGAHGVLHRYENGQWHSEDVAMKFRGVPDDGPFGWAGAAINLAADGSIWLTAGNVWRRRPGQAWREVQAGPLDFYAATFVGRGPQRMWFTQDGELVWVAADAATQGKYTTADMSLAADASIRAVADDGRQVLVSTSHGLAALEAGQWVARPPANPQLQTAAVASGPDGGAWLVAYGPFDPVPIWIAAGTLTGIAMLLLVVVWRWCRLPKRVPTFRYGVAIVAVFLLIGLELLATQPALDDEPSEFASALAPVMVCVLSLPLPLLLVMLRWFQFRGARGMERISFAPVAEHELPRRTLRYFDQHTGELESLGFRRLADYRLKRHTPFFARVFLSEDGQTYGEIATQRALVFVEIKACSFVSMFASGDYLETGNLAGKDKHAGKFHNQYAGRRPLAQVYATHQANAATICQQHDTITVPLEADDFPVVSTYGQKLLYDAMMHDGIVTANPYQEAVVPRIAELAGV